MRFFRNEALNSGECPININASFLKNLKKGLSLRD